MLRRVPVTKEVLRVQAPYKVLTSVDEEVLQRCGLVVGTTLHTDLLVYLLHHYYFLLLQFSLPEVPWFQRLLFIFK